MAWLNQALHRDFSFFRHAFPNFVLLGDRIAAVGCDIVLLLFLSSLVCTGTVPHSHVLLSSRSRPHVSESSGSPHVPQFRRLWHFFTSMSIFVPFSRAVPLGVLIRGEVCLC